MDYARATLDGESRCPFGKFQSVLARSEKHEFAKPTSSQVHSGRRTPAGTVVGTDSKYLAGPSRSALGRLQKTRICKTNSRTGALRRQGFHWDCRRHRFEVPRWPLTVRAGSSTENTNLQNKPPCQHAAGRTVPMLVALSGKPTDHGSTAPYVGRMTRSHRSLPADFDPAALTCDRSLSNQELR